MERLCDSSSGGLSRGDSNEKWHWIVLCVCVLCSVFEHSCVSEMPARACMRNVEMNCAPFVACGGHESVHVHDICIYLRAPVFRPLLRNVQISQQ